MGVLALTCISQYAHAQIDYTSFFIRIEDANYVPSVQTITSGEGGVTVTFSQSNLNTISSNYHLRQFHLAFPGTTDEDLDNIYLVEVNDINYMDEIVAFDDSKFLDPEIAVFHEYYIEITDPNYVPAYSFNNYVTTISFTQSALNDIAADYAFNNFSLAFPNSTDPALQNVYVVGVNNGGFPIALNNYNAGVFLAPVPGAYYKFAISVVDPDYIAFASMNMNYQTLYTFNNASVQAIANNYRIRKFEPLYPGSDFEHLRQIYMVECNDLQFMNDLIAFDNTIYPRGREMHHIAPLATTNDYGCTQNLFPNPSHQHQRYLDLIEAKTAWDYSTGVDAKVGICDWYVDIDHPEILPPAQAGSKVHDIFSNNKTHFYHNPNTNQPDPDYYSHGTAVFGTIAGATNNGLGMASIGYNVKVGIYSHQDANNGHNNARILSKKGYRAINCSWGYQFICRNETDDKTENSFYLSADLEDIYNEIYNNGAVAVFGAGNGGPSSTLGGVTCDNSSFRYPASLNHNLSITSVGSDVSQLNAILGSKSVFDEHERTRKATPDPDRQENHHHNTEVDLCAPGYTVHALDYDRKDATKKYQPNIAGTSIAAPLVTGTIGLMVAKKPCLTPYQIEYLLKDNAASSIYNLSANSPYVNPKRLGAGRLDAGATLAAVNNFNCNSVPPDLQTMYIEEIKISNVCWTGNPATSNIQLTPVIKNGNGNYEYRWQYISNGTATLDDQYIATPTVVASYPPHVLYLLLIVKEKNKDIPRVASKRIKVNLITDVNRWDIAIKDAYEDNFNEANDMDIVYSKNWDYWNSPWIWNTFASNNSSLPHHNPEYSTVSDNYLHIRVKNVGCAAVPSSEVEVKTYWTIAAAGENWPVDWTTGNMQGTNGTEPQGREITDPSNPIYVGALAKGGEQIISIPWHPIDPADYVSNNEIATCIYVRLFEHNTTNPPNGLDELTAPIDTHLRHNIRQNNNIATRNWYTTDYSSPKREHTVRALFANQTDVDEILNLQVITNKDIMPTMTGNLSAYLYGVIHLGDLFDIWVDGGYEGNVTEYDEIAKTVFYDPSVPLHLNNLVLGSYEKYPIDFEFKLRDNIDVPDEVKSAVIHFRQTKMITPPNSEVAEEVVLGAVSFSVAIDTMSDTSSGSKHAKSQLLPFEENARPSTNHYVKAYPNPAKSNVYFSYQLPKANEHLMLTITNTTGQVIAKYIQNDKQLGTFNWEVGKNASGVYFYNLSDGNLILDRGRVVITK